MSEIARALIARVGVDLPVMNTGKRSDRISLCLVQFKEHLGWQRAVVELANKNA